MNSITIQNIKKKSDSLDPDCFYIVLPFFLLNSIWPSGGLKIRKPQFLRVVQEGCGAAEGRGARVAGLLCSAIWGLK